MNIDDRIERRLRSAGDSEIVRDFDVLSPVVHVDNPTGRGSGLEQLLDALDPAFAGSRPPDIYVHGPKGTGKSAVVSVLIDRLAAHGGRQADIIHTTTRATGSILPDAVYVDARSAGSAFRIYRSVLGQLSDEPVPEQGVKTDTLRERLGRRASQRTEGIVVAVDHVGEPETHDLDTVLEILGEASNRIACLAIGRQPPTELDATVEKTVSFGPYRHHTLVDILTARTSEALTRDVLTHEQIREVAEWAEGDAHDALSAVFGAAVTAEEAGHDTVETDDLDAGVGAVPRPSVALGRVLRLPANRQRLLRELISLDEQDNRSVAATTEAIAESERIDLSESTIKRILYELADSGYLERKRLETQSGRGRPPSRIEPRFPTAVFGRLFDAEQ
ncbi:MAG: AAA family ATPase [Natronomonas sp.]